MMTLKQGRFDALWLLLLDVDPDGNADLTPGRVGAVVGCSERQARRMIKRKIRRKIQQ